MIGLAGFFLMVGIAGAQQVQMPLPAASIPQFVEPLPLLELEFINATSITLPGLLEALGPGQNTLPFNVDAEEFRSQILPSVAVWPAAPPACGPDTASSTFGYIGNATSQLPKAIDPVTGIHTTYLGPVIIAQTGVASNPIYGNNLPVNGVVQNNLPIDQTLDWANPIGDTGPDGCDPGNTGFWTNPTCGFIPYAGPMPIATHLHGGEVAPAFDGGPDAWFTPGNATVGAGWPGAQYNYPNNQQEGTIWFHDHALGITRLNVYAGLAGLQPIIDPANLPVTALPQLTDGYDIPLIIQDRTFDTTCEIMYNLASNPMPNPAVHPFWIPEFIGDTIVVNGKTWPYLDVEPRQYRFRFVNGSNARFYELELKSADDPVTGVLGTKLPMLAIATDDGYLMNAVSTNLLVIGPGERYEVVVDFSGVTTPVTMFNKARTPYPGGGKVVKGLTDRVMQIRVNLPLSAVPDTAVVAGSPLRDPVLNPIHPIVTAHNPGTGSITRQLTLNEVIGAGGPLELVVNNSKFNLALPTPGCNTTMCRETEIPAVGDTEDSCSG
jgi:FtsP/CotA-like multicopper oxidase with cupredoxin domain